MTSENSKNVSLALPKKPLPAYLKFQAELLGDKWETMSSEEKQPFILSYENDKKKWKKGEKKPLSPYFRFQKSLEIPEKWKNATPQLKMRFKEKYLEEKKQYDLDVAAYNAKYQLSALEAPKPPKKPMRDFFLFMKHVRQNLDSDDNFSDLRDKTTKQFISEVSKKWKTLSNDERKRFTTEAIDLEKQYRIELKRYEEKWGAPKYVASQKRKARSIASNAIKKEKTADEKRIRREEVQKTRKLIKSRAIEKKSKQKAYVELTVEKNSKKAKQFYQKYWLEKELAKFQQTALRITTASLKKPVLFDRNLVLKRIDEKWDSLNTSTRAGWFTRYKKTLGPTPIQNGKQKVKEVSRNHDDDSEINSNNEDTDEEECESENSQEYETADNCDEDEYSDIEDIENYGDDGDDFVVADDVIIYEDGITSEEIEEAEQLDNTFFNQ